MAYEIYYVELVKETGPSQFNKVLVPIDPNMLPVLASNGRLTPVVSAAGIVDATVTPAKTSIVQAVTATDTGATTGVILDTTTHATVTSGGSTKIVTLPTPTPGRVVVIDVGANGFKLKSTASASVAINGGSGASAVSAIAANSTCVMFCVSATAWKGFFMDADADVAKVAAAA